ncbi:MAG: hypothetical protein ACI3XM_09500 [Eubacteriales bacterium]
MLPSPSVPKASSQAINPHDEAATSSVPFLRLSNVHIIHTLAHAKTEHGQDFCCGFSSLRDLGLFAMLGAVLSNPAFTYAPGGMQKLLLRHCKNRYYSMHGALRRLQKDGYVIRTRVPLPDKKNCFHDYYTLCDKPLYRNQEDLDDRAAGTSFGVRNLTLSKGASFTASYQPYLPPTEDFTMISIPMLYDPRLSLAAKGLYAVIARYLRLSAYQKEIVLSKSFLRSMCREGDNAFDRLFRELRQAGYLQLTRNRNPKTGYGHYTYTLHPVGMQNISDKNSTEGTYDSVPDAFPLHTDSHETVMFQDSRPSVCNERNRQNMQTAATQMHGDAGLSGCISPLQKNGRVPAANAEGSSDTGNTANAVIRRNREPDSIPTLKRIREQIEYDCLIEEYPRQRLDCVVSILTSFARFLSDPGSGYDDSDHNLSDPPLQTITIGGIAYAKSDISRRLSLLDSEDIRFVLDTYETVSHHQIIRNVRAYLTACLFHAKENLEAAMDELINRVPGSAVIDAP